ncbi:NACHT, LRR and PYD domains-containing protein 1b allele 3-like [Scomber japonicus]|uniref:NACHT, LRR and PYD domains-containing protein 1b allele 3-like n=1 Tax=Scomber japonicus TaxID=13676 RepID=UPI0023052FA3|nr:NACHT, LRR and PYD domains-containing protein 1b allele 3-like [Scomber japonicus]
MAGVKYVVFLAVVNFLWSPGRGDDVVSCTYMESCILPCSFQGGDDAMILWTNATAQDTGETIHSYYSNTDQLALQDQRFKGRTSLFRDQISRGNASLHLTGVKVQDQGRYKCSTSSDSGIKESFINLITVDDPGLNRRDSGSTPNSHSAATSSQIVSPDNKNFTRAESLPDILLKDSFEEFTPDITVDENEETYRFHCSGPGLYQCTLTGLVFHMEGEGDVVYRIVSWNHRILANHHKKPAGPLFDIKCLQQSVCQLHLPHCEIRSTGGCEFLTVAHVIDEGIEFITPHKITETHVIINIIEFSGFGMVKDEDSPPDPVRALVLLFYRPPTDPDAESVLNVLLLPKNVVLRDVLRMRKEYTRDERYIEISPHCDLIPKQEYTLSTSPEDDSVLVQPKKAKFYEELDRNYFPSFQVIFKQIMKNIKLFLIDTNSSSNVWESEVFLTPTEVRNSQRQSSQSLPSTQRLKYIRTGFIDGISGPVLQSLLDKLFEKKVITEPERESANDMQNKRDKARFVIDTVRKKGEAASSEMIELLCEIDPFLCKHLGLI